MFLLVALCPRPEAQAGGGAHNVVVVVNAASPSSLAIANEYIALRRVPPSNVVYLTGIPDEEESDFATLRNTILRPLFEEIDKRGIGDHIDCIAWSADFPTAYRFTPQARAYFDEKKMPLNDATRAIGSLNSLTFYYEAVFADQFAFMGGESNWYARGPARLLLTNPFVGEDREAYAAAIESLGDGQFDEARQTLLNLSARHPAQVALHYQLARCEALAGKPSSATRSLINAVRTGWCYREFTSEDAAFDKLGDDPLFQGVLSQIDEAPFLLTPTIGFRHNFYWGANRMPNSHPSQGRRYILSTVLAVTRNRGTTEAEAIDALRRSVAADFTQPRGTFYFCQTKDIRTRSRSPNFPATVAELQRLGHTGQTVTGHVPVGRRDILGVCMGEAKFSWPVTNAILPGAICENFTSYGGVMRKKSSQTPLTEFIRHGAAGSSGTVTEPLSIAAKFPHPFLYVHYVRGCSLAESFYQSVAAPFQLLIVGDPLCQPFAVRPRFVVEGIARGQRLTDSVDLTIAVTDDSRPVAAVETLIDGIRVSATRVDESIPIDVTNLADGWHELRVVAVAADNIRTQSTGIIPFWVDRQGRSVKLEVTSSTQPRGNGEIKLTVTAEPDAPVEIRHNGRTVGQLDAAGTVTVPARLLGRGKVTLQAVALHDDQLVASEPVEIEIGN